MLTVAVTGASAIFLPGNARRVGLLISAPLAARVTISVSNPAVLDNGLTIQPLTAPLRLDIREVGNWITKDLYAIGAGAETIGVVESLWEDLS